MEHTSWNFPTDATIEWCEVSDSTQISTWNALCPLQFSQWWWQSRLTSWRVFLSTLSGSPPTHAPFSFSDVRHWHGDMEFMVKYGVHHRGNCWDRGEVVEMAEGNGDRDGERERIGKGEQRKVTGEQGEGGRGEMITVKGGERSLTHATTLLRCSMSSLLPQPPLSSCATSS